MIELVVAMVLLAVALSLASGALIQQFSGSRGARSGAVTDAAIAKASARFVDDVAAARTQDLVASELREPAEFADAVRNNAPATSGNPATPGRALDLDPVLLATDREVRLQVEADAARVGLECVTWRAETTTSLRITRLVDPSAGCGSGALGSATMLSVPLEIPGIDRTPFSFEVACNGCGPGVTCRPQALDSVPANRLRWIVAIGATFDVASGSTPASGRAKSAIRVRDTDTYRRALGC